MTEIKNGQELLLENVLTFRGKLSQVQMQQVGADMENTIKEPGLERKDTLVTVTYGMEDGINPNIL